jgi:hypothetical protein
MASLESTSSQVAETADCGPRIRIFLENVAKYYHLPFDYVVRAYVNEYNYSYTELIKGIKTDHYSNAMIDKDIYESIISAVGVPDDALCDFPENILTFEYTAQAMAEIEEQEALAAQQAVEQPALQQAVEQPALQQAVEQPALQQAVEQPALQQAVEQPALQQAMDDDQGAAAAAPPNPVRPVEVTRKSIRIQDMKSRRTETDEEQTSKSAKRKNGSRRKPAEFDDGLVTDDEDEDDEFELFDHDSWK